MALQNFTECASQVRTVFGNASGEAATTLANFPIMLPSASGSMAVFCMAADNAASGGVVGNLPSVITDTQSNTWVQRVNAVSDPAASGASQGCEIAIWTSVLTTGLGVSDTITITYDSANVSAKVGVLYEFAPTGAGPMSYVSGGSGTAGTAATTGNVTTTSITSGDYVVAMYGGEGAAGGEPNFTPDADTTNGTWSGGAVAGRGAVAGNMSIISQCKLTTGTATQSYDTTMAASDSIGAWISVHDASTGLTARQKAGFFQMF